MLYLFEIGFFSSFYNLSNPLLSLIVYGCVAVSFIIEFLVLNKAKKPKTKYVYPSIILILCVTGEVLAHIVTGWDIFAVLILYGVAACGFIGSILALILFSVRKNKKT